MGLGLLVSHTSAFDFKVRLLWSLLCSENRRRKRRKMVLSFLKVTQVNYLLLSSCLKY